MGNVTAVCGIAMAVVQNGEVCEMQTVKILYSVNDDIYEVSGEHWNNKKRTWGSYIVEKYRIRSIAISCNAKEEWKLSYRAQKVVDGKTVDYGFNFCESDVGDFIFTNYEDAKARCEELNKEDCKYE